MIAVYRRNPSGYDIPICLVDRKDQAFHKANADAKKVFGQIGPLKFDEYCTETSDFDYAEARCCGATYFAQYVEPHPR